MSFILLLLGLLFLIFSKLLRNNAKDIRGKNKIQEGEIFYSDLNKPTKALFSKRYMIAGKPDYIVNDNGRIYPVEYKSGVHDHVLDNHRYQLAAYCYLIEENFNVFVPFGVIVYSDKQMFKVPFDPKVRFEFEDCLKKMRSSINSGRIFRNHNNKNKCSFCSMKDFCDFKIK